MATAQPAYGGSILQNGSLGPDVSLIQKWLNGVRADWPGIPAVTVDGKFGNATANAVRAFQTVSGLTSDGRVGSNTWGALGTAYAEAQGSGEVYPGTSLRQGHTGATVASAQQKLKTTAPALVVDGKFGARTKAAVTAYQTSNGLSADGIIGPNTWARLYS